MSTREYIKQYDELQEQRGALKEVNEILTEELDKLQCHYEYLKLLKETVEGVEELNKKRVQLHGDGTLLKRVVYRLEAYKEIKKLARASISIQNKYGDLLWVYGQIELPRKEDIRNMKRHQAVEVCYDIVQWLLSDKSYMTDFMLKTLKLKDEYVEKLKEYEKRMNEEMLIMEEMGKLLEQM